MSVAMGIHESIFNNFLSDTFSMSAGARGWLEFPRELPGFLVVVMAGILCALSVTRMGVVGAGIFAAGMAGMALLGESYWMMLTMMVVGSTGMHLLQPVGASIALGLSDEHNKGTRMGQMGAVGTAGTVLGAGVIWLMFDEAAPPYQLGFACVALLGLVCAGVYAVMHIPHLSQPRARLVFRKRFWLFYLLEFAFGARKQIFITFGPWVLIRVYGLPAAEIAGLLMAASIVGIVFKPLAGMAVDRFGERTIMVLDGLLLAVVCVGYGYALRITDTPEDARLLACACFIADDLLFALGSARAVYLSRMTKSNETITSTLALGITVNHLASMTIPMVAGAIWVGFGYERVFLAAAALALSISALSSLVPAKGAFVDTGASATTTHGDSGN
jgi:MFS family permease